MTNKYWLCVTPDRVAKTTMLMNALQKGMFGEGKLIVGAPPDDGRPFVVWGQEWTALSIIPKAYAEGRPFWHIDNGFWNPGRGGSSGYYRMAYRGMTPILLNDPVSFRTTGVKTKPWRTNGSIVLLAMPGIHFGMALGIDVHGWCETILGRVKASTNRMIRVRERHAKNTLASDFNNVWAVVTHSSNVAVDAVCAGLPVFVQPTCPAAPVGKLDLDIEHPVMPDRTHWLNSLACQHFNVAEMSIGVAYRWMQAVEEQVDGGQHEPEKRYGAA